MMEEIMDKYRLLLETDYIMFSIEPIEPEFGQLNVI